MIVTYYETRTAAAHINHPSVTPEHMAASYKTEGHFRHVAPLVNAYGELMWRASLIQALACEARLTSGGAK